MLATTREPSQGYGSLLASLSAVFYGLMAYFGTMLLRNDFTLMNMLFWRFTIATAWILLCMFFLKKSLVPNLDKRTIVQTLVVAGLLYSGASALYFMSMSYIGTGLATAIFFTFPVFVALFTAVVNRRWLNKHTMIALLSICIGVALVKGQHGGSARMNGAMIAVMGAFLYAIYIYRSKAISHLVDPYLLTLLVCGGTATVFFIYCYATNQLEMPKEFKDWVHILAIGILATALPIQLLLASLKYISPIKVSILASLRVVVTILIGYALLQEQITLWQFFGVMTILFASMIAQKAN